MPEIEIIPVGGYSDFGRNMTAVRVGREIVIFDMGVRLDRITIHEDAVFDEMHPVDLQRLGAIPDDTVLRDVPGKVVAIVIGHGHLDHVGAVAKLAGHYKDAPIYGTPFTMKLIEDMVRLGPPGKPQREEQGETAAEGHRHGATHPKAKRSVPNRLIAMNAGETRKLTDHIDLEFVHVTHSILQTVFPVLHTDRGAIVYGLDFKFDNAPVIGQKPDYKRLRELALEGVVALVSESTNAGNETKTPSETIARDMLEDFLFGVDNERDGIIISTFSSHAARIKSIAEFGDKLGREVLLLGRSMEKYTEIARNIGLLKLPAGTKSFGFGRSVQQQLKRVMKEKDRYIVVATGHQGEPGSLLTRIASKDLPYDVEKGDQIIFSSNVIPNPVNEANRYILETKLKMQGARIIKGAHVSGHASRVEHQELLKMLEPSHIFPAHGGIDLQAHYVELAEREGYTLNDTVHLLRNRERMIIPRD